MALHYVLTTYLRGGGEPMGVHCGGSPSSTMARANAAGDPKLCSKQTVELRDGGVLSYRTLNTWRRKSNGETWGEWCGDFTEVEHP